MSFGSKSIVTAAFVSLVNPAFGEQDAHASVTGAEDVPRVRVAFQETTDGFVNMTIIAGNGNRNRAISANSEPEVGAVFYTTSVAPSRVSDCPEVVGTFPRNVGGLFHRRYPVTSIVREAIDAAEDNNCVYIHQ